MPAAVDEVAGACVRALADSLPSFEDIEWKLGVDECP
jgi:hypothetical protein